RIELTGGVVEGYYEQQGWRPGTVHTMSRFDRPSPGGTVSLRSGPTVLLSGIAFAGDRGISRVEVSADGGRTWQDARIDYAPSSLTWALWSFAWTPHGPGQFVLVVRATDGTGAVQPS